MADSCVMHLWVLSARLSPAALRVYLAICSHTNRRGEAWPSQARLASLCACSVDQVRRAVAELKRRGFIRANPLHGHRHLTYVVQRRVGQVPPYPCFFDDPILAPVQGEELREALIHTKAPTERHPKPWREEAMNELDQKTTNYINDLCLVLTLDGRTRSSMACKRKLIQQAASGSLNMSNADMVHQLAAAFRATKKRH